MRMSAGNLGTMSDNQALDTFDGLNYEEIEQAVMETSRGRWFLTEFARRHKAADTAVLLDAIRRLEDQIQTRSAEAANTSVKQPLDGLEGLAELDEQPAAEFDDSASEPEISGKLDRTAKLVRSLRSSHKLISKAADKPLRPPLPLSNAKPRASTAGDPPGYVGSDDDIFADDNTVSTEAEPSAEDTKTSVQLEDSLPVDGDTLNFADIDMPDAGAAPTGHATPVIETDDEPEASTGQQGSDRDNQDTDSPAAAENTHSSEEPDTTPEPVGVEQSSVSSPESPETDPKSKKRIIVIRRPADNPGDIPLAGSDDEITGDDAPAT